MATNGAFQADLEKYYRIEFAGEEANLRRRLKLWITHFGLHCVAVYRLGRWARGRLKGNPLALAAFVVYEFLCFLVKLIHHVDVFAATIGPGFYIGHAGTIYIGKTRVGANFSVAHNVTVGLGAARSHGGVPVLGDDVWVGPGSILYGDIAIGNGVAVNGGTVLSRSLPDRCMAGGNPGRVILLNYNNAALFGGTGWIRDVQVDASGKA
jgi:serine O-acetyltransferase